MDELRTMPSFTSKGTKGLPSVAMSSKVWSSTDIRRGQNKKPALTIRKRYRKPAWTLKTALGSVKTPVGSSARPDKINKRVETKRSKKKVFFTRKKSKGSLPTFSVRKKKKTLCEGGAHLLSLTALPLPTLYWIKYSFPTAKSTWRSLLLYTGIEPARLSLDASTRLSTPNLNFCLITSENVSTYNPNTSVLSTCQCMVVLI